MSHTTDTVEQARVDDGGPAFPVATIDGYMQAGMSLRDYFAAKAMEGMQSGGARISNMANTVHWAYEIADAMLKARRK